MRYPGNLVSLVTLTTSKICKKNPHKLLVSSRGGEYPRSHDAYDVPTQHTYTHTVNTIPDPVETLPFPNFVCGR